MPDKKPLIVDICIPFCNVTEKYSFRLQHTGSNYEKNNYIHALLREVNSYKDELEDYSIKALRLSGGAVTVMKPDLLGELLARTANTLPLAPEAEISFEALPGTLNVPTLAGVCAGRPNRAEFLLHSVNTAELRALGYFYTERDIRNALPLFPRFHLNNLGITVNSGIPGQTAESLLKTLDFCVEAQPAHISILPLDDTNAPGAPAAEDQRGMYAAAAELLQNAGYNQYGSGLFCLPGHENSFESLLRSGCEVLGIGAGAQSYMGGYLIRNTGNVLQYTLNAGNFEKITAEVTELGAVAHAGRFVYGRLGMSSGFGMQELEERFGAAAEAIKPIIEKLIQNGFAEIKDGRVVPTAEGLFNYRQAEEYFAG